MSRIAGAMALVAVAGLTVPGCGPDRAAVSGDSGAPSYPPHPEPGTEGLTIGVDDAFWTSMDDFVFGAVEPSGLRLYLTLLDGNFYDQPPYRALGMEIVRHPESFFVNAVIPLVQRYGATEAVWAIDCMNEPEALVAGPSGNYESWGVSWDEMQHFLAFCADTVHFNSSLPVSAGAGWHDWDNVLAGRYDESRLDFLDYHLYADAPSPPPVSELQARLPMVIGECGQLSHVWDDQLQLRATRACLAGAAAGGYLAAFTWQYDFAGSIDPYAHLAADGSWRPVADAFAELAGSFGLGVNLAWLSGAYDHDFGPNPFHPEWGVAYDGATARAAVADLRRHGVALARTWVFEGQEGLPVHMVYDDFEEGLDGWQSSSGAVTLDESLDHTADGMLAAVVHVEATEPGWYGIVRRWPSAARLNLAPTAAWSWAAADDLDVPIGVNLAFVTGAGPGPRYQTRAPGQLWLGAHTSGRGLARLDDASFADTWALDVSPATGATRPSVGDMQDVSAIEVRFYLGPSQLPARGDVYLDAIRIR